MGMFQLGGWWYDSEMEKLEIGFVEKMGGFCIEMLVGHQVSLCNGQFLYGFGTQEGGLLRVRFRMVSMETPQKSSIEEDFRSWLET